VTPWCPVPLSVLVAILCCCNCVLQILYQPIWNTGCAKTQGEEAEILFSYLSRLAGRTRNMSAAGAAGGSCSHGCWLTQGSAGGPALLINSTIRAHLHVGMCCSSELRWQLPLKGCLCSLALHQSYNCCLCMCAFTQAQLMLSQKHVCKWAKARTCGKHATL